MQKVDLAELRRLHEAATNGENWQEAAMFTEACKRTLPATPAQSLAAHDAALLRALAEKLDGEGHPTNEYYRNWLMAEADRIEREESESKNGEENDRKT